MDTRVRKSLGRQYITVFLMGLAALMYFWYSIYSLGRLEKAFFEIDAQMLRVSNTVLIKQNQNTWSNMSASNRDSPEPFDYKQVVSQLVEQKAHAVLGDPYPIYYAPEFEGVDMNGNSISVKNVLLLTTDTQMKPISNALCKHYMTTGFEKRGNRNYGCLSKNGTNTLWEELYK